MASTLRIGPLEFPVLGLGTLRNSGAECRQLVEAALAKGYLHIDTAHYYGNEDVWGRPSTARQSPVTRSG